MFDVRRTRTTPRTTRTTPRTTRTTAGITRTTLRVVLVVLGMVLVVLGVVLVVLEANIKQNIEHCFLNSEQRSRPSLHLLAVKAVTTCLFRVLLRRF